MIEVMAPEVPSLSHREAEVDRLVRKYGGPSRGPAVNLPWLYVLFVP